MGTAGHTEQRGTTVMRSIPSGLLRATASIAVLALFAACGASGVTAQDGKGQPKKITLNTGDGLPLVMTYYPVIEKAASAGAQEAGVIVLLHGDDKGRIQWDQLSGVRLQDGRQGDVFPVRLQNEGYAVITVDLRKFGDSKSGDTGALKPIDYEAMAAYDLAAVKNFIFEEHQNRRLNMNKMAIVAAGPMCPVAAAYTVMDWQMPPFDDAPVGGERTPRGQDVRALVFLSPDGGAGRLATAQTLKFIRAPELGIALLVVVGKNDSHDRGQAKKIFDLAAAGQRKGEQRIYMLSPNLKDRGLGLIGKLDDQVDRPILVFLDKHIKQLDSPWRDRRNKITAE